MFIGIFDPCMSMHQTHVLWSRNLEEGVTDLGTEVIHSYKSPCGYSDLNLGPMEELQVVLTPKLSLSDPNIILTSRMT